MSISISSLYSRIFVLAWYHNGSRIMSSDRIIITDNGTSLTIHSTIDSDAGQYEVKIYSKTFYRNGSCESDLLPVLENTALSAPATFLYNKILVLFTIQIVSLRISQFLRTMEEVSEELLLILPASLTMLHYCWMSHFIVLSWKMTDFIMTVNSMPLYHIMEVVLLKL